MFNKKFMFMAIFIVGLLAISAAGAADLNTADEVAIDGDDLQISMGDENIIQKNAEVENDLENDANEFFSAVSLENDDYYVSGDDSNLTEAKLEVVKTPTNPGDNTVIFKLTKVEDNSPLANVSLGVKSDYDHFIDGIITDSNGLATYYHALESGTYSLIAGLGDADGFGSSSETLHCDLLFFSITIKEQTDGSVNEIVVSGNTFTDIQNAVSSVKKGGTVKLSGKYEGTGIPIRINRNITLIGVGNTILDGNCSSLILRIVSSGVSIKGLTFINGYTDIDDFRNAANRISAGAIQATGNNTLIQNCIFLSNQGFMYGAIELNGNHSTIEDCSFTANEVYLNGRYTEYVYESDGRRKDITYAYENTAGAFKWSGNDNLLSNCEFIDNVGYVDFIFEGKNNVIKESKLVLSASDVTKYMGGSEKYTVTLTDNGVPVANVNVKINVNGKESTVKTNSKGQASADLNMGVGSYDVISEYGDLRTASKVNVKSTITVADAKGTYLNSKASATFLNTNGKALANTKVNFKIGTETYSATTNSNGVATANIDLGVGTYTVTAVNPVNNEQKQFKLTISKSSSSAKVSVSQNAKDVTLTAALTPATATGKVTFYINDKKTSEVAIKNGKASITLHDLAPGKYSASAIYGGDSNLDVYISGSTSFKIDDVYPILAAYDFTKTYGDADKFVVNLKDSKGNAIANAVVNVDINGEITPITTDSNGQAAMAISLKPASYDATATYGSAQDTAKIVVKKATPKMAASKKTFKASVKTKKYTITLKTNMNKVMKNKKVTLKVNGKTYKATTNSKGKATFKITKLTKKGKFTAVVKYAGSKYYNAKAVKAKITVK